MPIDIIGEALRAWEEYRRGNKEAVKQFLEETGISVKTFLEILREHQANRQITKVNKLLERGELYVNETA